MTLPGLCPGPMPEWTSCLEASGTFRTVVLLRPISMAVSARSPYCYCGSEPSMLRTVGDQPSLWEALLPPEVLGLSPELAKVDNVADRTDRPGHRSDSSAPRRSGPSGIDPTGVVARFGRSTHPQGPPRQAGGVTRRMLRCWPRPSNESHGDAGDHRTRSLRIAATAKPAWTRPSPTTSVSATSPSPDPGHRQPKDEPRSMPPSSRARPLANRRRGPHRLPETPTRLGRCHLPGIEGARTWCGHGILTHNLTKIARLTT